jgi:hypothetical protein
MCSETDLHFRHNIFLWVSVLTANIHQIKVPLGFDWRTLLLSLYEQLSWNKIFYFQNPNITKGRLSCVSRTSDAREPHAAREPRCGYPCYIPNLGSWKSVMFSLAHPNASRFPLGVHEYLITVRSDLGCIPYKDTTAFTPRPSDWPEIEPLTQDRRCDYVVCSKGYITSCRAVIDELT